MGVYSKASSSVINKIQASSSKVIISKLLLKKKKKKNEPKRKRIEKQQKKIKRILLLWILNTFICRAGNDKQKKAKIWGLGKECLQTSKQEKQSYYDGTLV